MFCGKCGSSNPDTELVCQSCGAPLEATPVQPPPVPQPVAAYPQAAPYGYPQPPYQAPRPRKPFFDGPFNSPGWWESAARLAAYIVGGWGIIDEIIFIATYSSSYYSSISAWSALSGIISALTQAALKIAVVTLITFTTKYLRENAANTATLVTLKKEEANKKK